MGTDDAGERADADSESGRHARSSVPGSCVSRRGRDRTPGRHGLDDCSGVGCAVLLAVDGALAAGSLHHPWQKTSAAASHASRLRISIGTLRSWRRCARSLMTCRRRWRRSRSRGCSHGERTSCRSWERAGATDLGEALGALPLDLGPADLQRIEQAVPAGAPLLSAMARSRPRCWTASAHDSPLRREHARRTWALSPAQVLPFLCAHAGLRLRATGHN